MHPTFVHRLATALALTTMLGIVFSASVRASASNAVFQPLNSPATKDRLPGKFVWADLFTTDPVAATKFYSGLFGWTANKIEQNGKSYTVFSNGSRPVAGLAPRPASLMKRASRWIGYVTVTDINATLAGVKKAGGKVRAPALDFPDRGFQAIIADNEGNSIGVIQSSSGDSRDVEPKPGDWNWFELYVKKPQAAADFYARVFNYEVAPDTRTERKNDYLISSGGHARGGIAPLPDSDDVLAEADWLAVVRVANMDEAIKRVTALGGEVLLAPRPPAYETRFAIIADSTGGTIGLLEYVDNANPANHP